MAESHTPLLVNVGVRNWKARMVPVGRRLARLAVLDRVCEMARWVRVGGCAGVFGVSGSVTAVLVEAAAVDEGVSKVSGCWEVVGGLCLIDILYYER